MPVSDDVLTRGFTEHRRYLLAVAYRLTSSLADAEDAVQESWLRLSGVDADARAGITDLRAWLVTVVSRICLDRLRSAAARREHYAGPSLPEPVVTPLPQQPGEDPAEASVRDDGVRMAVLVVLDTLGPEQRVAFVLHDAFSVPFDEIAEVLGCSTAAARQYASRARRAVAAAEPPPRIELHRQQDLLGRFMAAMQRGDIGEIVGLLHPDAVYLGDGGGKARTARRPVRGPERIARLLLGLLRQYGEAMLAGRPVLVNGDLGMHLPASEGSPGHPPMDEHVFTFAVAGGRIMACYDIANPDKLTHLSR